MTSETPVVLVTCNSMDDYLGTSAHVTRDTYINALIKHAHCQPVLLPAAVDLRGLVGRVDGILLTGSAKHVHPARYGAELAFPESYLDHARDEKVLNLLEAAFEADTPVLAVCRGFQEINVACGGTLHQRLQDMPGKHDHRKQAHLGTLENYAHRAHSVKTQAGGLFEKWGFPASFDVNSLHEQGVNKLGKGLHAEAITEDGLVEAFSMPEKTFVVGLQWHPEGELNVSPQAVALFENFGKALRNAQKRGA